MSDPANEERTERSAAVKRYFRDQFGEALIEDQDLTALLNQYCREAFEAFPELFRERIAVNEETAVQISDILIYDGSERGTTGESVSRAHKSEPGEWYSVLCISSWAILKGREETILTLFHELIHAVYKTDNPLLFHGLLDGLLLKYAERTGETIPNDYIVPV